MRRGAVAFLTRDSRGRAARPSKGSGRRALLMPSTHHPRLASFVHLSKLHARISRRHVVFDAGKRKSKVTVGSGKPRTGRRPQCVGRRHLSNLEFLLVPPPSRSDRKRLAKAARLKLPVTAKDLDRLVSLARSPVLARFIGNLRIVYTDKEVAKYLTAMTQRNRRNQRHGSVI
jgi:hypothetical protein